LILTKIIKIVGSVPYWPQPYSPQWVIPLFGYVFRQVLNSDWDQRSAKKWSRFSFWLSV